jgi:hypothetical protein
MSFWRYISIYLGEIYLLPLLRREGWMNGRPTLQGDGKWAHKWLETIRMTRYYTTTSHQVAKTIAKLEPFHTGRKCTPILTCMNERKSQYLERVGLMNEEKCSELSILS